LKKKKKNPNFFFRSSLALSHSRFQDSITEVSLIPLASVCCRENSQNLGFLVGFATTGTLSSPNSLLTSLVFPNPSFFPISLAFLIEL
jgi:hypothetical protein